MIVICWSLYSCENLTPFLIVFLDRAGVFINQVRLILSPSAYQGYGTEVT